MERKSGVLMHVSSLWGEYGSGSFGLPAREFVDFLNSCGFSYWQVLPFCLPDDCHSPYKSYSAFSPNPFFIDLDELCAMGLLNEAELRGATQRTEWRCEFERLEERLALLEKASRRVRDYSAIDSWLASHEKTGEFCSFMALKKANGNRPWTEWTSTEPDGDCYKLWSFISYVFFSQWKRVKEYANSKGISIIGDVPIYVSWESADVWSSPEDFELDDDLLPSSVAGVPPDYFSEDGQLWGNPLYNWIKMEGDSFKWWRERMAFMDEYFDGVRIDHFRGIESYYSVQRGEKSAKHGSWRKGPGMALINAIKESFSGLIIAEDLGLITPEVEALRRESGFPGMRVLQFAFLGDGNSPHLPHNYENNSVAYTGTHDNNTLLGHIWEIRDGQRKALFDYCGFSGGDWNDSRGAIMRTMLASHAGLVIFPVQDLLYYGEDTRLNVPGQSDGNWSYRMTKSQLDGIDRRALRELIVRYGRK